MLRSPQRQQSAKDCAWAVGRRPLDFRRRSSDIDFGYNVHAGPELQIVILSRIDDDFYGDPLNDLDVIAGSIFRWKQAEKRPCCAGDAVDVTLVCPPVGIDVKL